MTVESTFLSTISPIQKLSLSQANTEHGIYVYAHGTAAAVYEEYVAKGQVEELEPSFPFRLFRTTQLGRLILDPTYMGDVPAGMLAMQSGIHAG